tara:strand:- start:286 stop:933 length:648 start_codon:yes stop_codon:yes gene_type:complete
MKSYSLNDLDIKLLKYLNYENGFFVEAGANDGLSQSNTALYEFDLSWRGLLIEPNKIKCEQAIASRPNSIVENYALVSTSYKEKTTKGDFSETGYGESLCAMICDVGDYSDDDLSYDKKLRIDGSNIVEVPCITVQELVDKHKIKEVDLFSLDVEGYELDVLNGIDFSLFRPKYYLIEMNYPKRKEAMLKYMEAKKYKFVEYLSGNDGLFIDGNL